MGKLGNHSAVQLKLSITCHLEGYCNGCVKFEIK